MVEYKDNTNNSAKKEGIDVLYSPSILLRISNYILDSIVIALILILLSTLIGFDIGYNKYLANQDLSEELKNVQYILLAISFCYYTAFEYIFGKTIGKVITKTKVVDIYGDRPNLLSIAIRSLVRWIIPFAALIIIFTKTRTLHDLLSKTYVVLDEK